MKTLNLIIHRKWFEMIASGKKKEEYRDITAHWCSRLEKKFGEAGRGTGPLRFKNFNTIKFKNGYAKNAPSVTVECTGISFDFPAKHLKWSIKDEWCYVISLGKILKIENYNPLNTP